MNEREKNTRRSWIVLVFSNFSKCFSI